MLWRTFQLAAAASFVLCLAVHILWLRSNSCTEKVDWCNSHGWRSVRTAAGHLEFGLLVADWSGQVATVNCGPHYQRGEVQPPFNPLLELCSSVGDKTIDWERGGFAWYAKLNSQRGVYYSTLVAPFWFLAGATMFLPLLSTVLRLKSRRPLAPSVKGGL